MQDLFDKIKEIENAVKGHENEKSFEIKLSYIEIYNELVYDLLACDKKSIDGQVLSIHEGKDKQLIVKGANEIQVQTIQEVL